MSIGIFGDSIAKGVVYDESKNKYTYLKNCFVNMFSQRVGFPVVNYARFGCTITKGAEILKKHEDELSSFSHTVLEFGGNDCDLKWDEISYSPFGAHPANVPLTQFEAIYHKMINIIRTAGSIPVMLTLPPLDPEKFFKWVSKGLNRENILKYLGDIRFIYKWHETYNNTIKNLAARHSIQLIDIRGAFIKEGDYSSFLCRDGMHPNEKGHVIIDRAIIDQIKSPGFQKYAGTFHFHR